jgi:hypothetical protein
MGLDKEWWLMWRRLSAAAGAVMVKMKRNLLAH